MQCKQLKSIFVAAEDTRLIGLGDGSKIIAAIPPNRGDGRWSCLTEKKFATVRGERIGTLGIESALKNAGYTKAAENDPRAERLRDEAAAREAIHAVEEASKATSMRLRTDLGGQKVSVVPFDAAQPIREVTVCPPDGFFAVALGLGVGMSSGMVSARDEKGLMADFEVNSCWVVPQGIDPKVMPRVSDYGGPMEEAMFVLSATGFGELIAPLAMLEEPPMDDPMPRGAMAMRLKGGDTLLVGSDAGDELLVRLVRNRLVVRERRGLLPVNGRLNVPSFIGSIAGILVLDTWAEASRPKRKIAKAA